MHPQEITDSKEVISNFLRVPVTEGQSLQVFIVPETKDGSYIVPEGKSFIIR